MPYRIRSIAAAVAISISAIALLQGQSISDAIAQDRCPDSNGYHRAAKHFGPIGTGTCFVDEELAEFARNRISDLESHLRRAKGDANDRAVKRDIERLETRRKALPDDSLDRDALGVVITTAKAMIEATVEANSQWYSFMDRSNASHVKNIWAMVKSERDNLLKAIYDLRAKRDELKTKDASVEATKDARERAAKVATRKRDSEVIDRLVTNLEAYEATFPIPKIPTIGGLFQPQTLPFMRQAERAIEILRAADAAIKSCNEKALLAEYNSAAIWVQNHINDAVRERERSATTNNVPVRFEARLAFLHDLRNFLQIAAQIEAILEEFTDQKFEKKFELLLTAANEELQRAIADGPKTAVGTRAKTTLAGLEKSYAKLGQVKAETRALRAQQRCAKGPLSDFSEEPPKKKE